jgi:hypothetical protein
VVSAETAISRTANAGRPFTGGLHLGRHINADIYAAVPPAEAIATVVAGGAARLTGPGCGCSGSSQPQWKAGGDNSPSNLVTYHEVTW